MLSGGYFIMEILKITQYLHRPNRTELGKGKTHDFYMRIENDLNLENMFPLEKEVCVENSKNWKIYRLKASRVNNEFRVSQMGELYADNEVKVGDEIIFTKIINKDFDKIYFTIEHKNRVVFTVNSNGAEIDNIELLENYRMPNDKNTYKIKITDRNVSNDLSITFKESKNKRTDSPLPTDYYRLQINGNDVFKGSHYLTLGNKPSFSTLRKSEFIEINLQNLEKEQNISLVNNTNDLPTNNKGCNVILYGVPGSGKSYTIDKEYKTKDSIEKRVVFHPDYTYSDFVGQLLPDTDEGGRVKYKFVPGPFTEILKSAYLNPGKNHILVIEEINRGNAPAIFGDIFQLLDRKDDGSSMYEITNKDIYDIVHKKDDTEKDNTETDNNDSKYKVTIPSNLSIIATMNTSDQNVFTLDTAFQRRWEMRLIENSFTSEHKYADKEILDTGVTWRTFCEVVNKIIVENSSSTASTEDKRLGVYFVKEEFLDMGDSKQMHRFPEKVIKYLWDDAFKFNREAIFTSKYHSLEDIIRGFVESSGFSRFDILKENLRNDLKVASNNSNSQL